MLGQDGRDFSSRIVSEGTLHVLALCAIAVNPWNGSLLAFEEPENGVHPRRLELIAQLLTSLAIKQSQQLIVTTHSPLFCDAILKQARSYPDEIALFNVCRGANGTEVNRFNVVGPLFEDAEIAQALISSSEDGLFESLMLRGCSMNSTQIDLFVEDRAHEEFIARLLERLARQQQRRINCKVRSARGVHGKVLEELSLYQTAVWYSLSCWLSRLMLTARALNPPGALFSRSLSQSFEIARSSPVLIHTLSDGIWRTSPHSPKWSAPGRKLAKRNVRGTSIKQLWQMPSSRPAIPQRSAASSLHVS
jgi:hypothetical protein